TTFNSIQISMAAFMRLKSADHADSVRLRGLAAGRRSTLTKPPVSTTPFPMKSRAIATAGGKRPQRLKNDSRPTSIRRPKRILFQILAVLLSVAVLMLAELILRLCGFGGYAPFFRNVGPVAGGTLVTTDQAGARSWFFNSDLAGETTPYAFLDPKPPNTFRIFIVGGSAAKGWPNPRNLTSSAFLQAMLQDAWPERPVEVINLGTVAVASYPVMNIMTEALNFDPDLVIIETGNNEFYGAYGVASTSRAGSKPWTLAATRLLHSSAMVQALEKLLFPSQPDMQHTLMEIMSDQNHIAPNDWRRTAAANNLYHNVGAMITRCQARGVPVLVCSVPTSENNLAPIGPAASDVPASEQARVHFQQARALAAEGKPTEALAEFVKARDLDTMPWRITSPGQEAIHRAAHEHGVPVCDLVTAFRGASPDGTIGWHLMDDHVHPTVRGQALMAETFLNSMTNVSAQERARVASWEVYAQELGDNPYDRYVVDLNMRTIFNAPFMRANNAEAFDYFDKSVKQFEGAADPETRAILRKWLATPPGPGGRRPLTSEVARLRLKQGKFSEALGLFQAARKSVPEYTSLHMEYTCLVLECKALLQGETTPADRDEAAREIERGQVLLHGSFSKTGFAGYYLARLHQLRSEYAEAVPLLNASRQQLSVSDRLAVDKALIASYLKTGAADQAIRIAQDGAEQPGPYASSYRNLLKQVKTLIATNAPVAN
ncbi:MAG: SGNH/GDSL hydrolase family protein, partial [Pontiellaceae bacterium]|nr:SGNH/GDSL hydrolase family protein [Pontiellaceae bacterium]MBN2786037.1 SGNH/GDSL hydrolase family protein [Pontiellaceae bacterium]